jgi:hypothetical protein
LEKSHLNNSRQPKCLTNPASRLLSTESDEEKKKQAMNKSTLRTTGLMAIGLMSGVKFAHAQTAGSLDPAFGTGGTVTTTFTGDTITPIGALEQSNGDIVVLSELDFVADSGTQIALTRYTSGGVLGHHFWDQG